LFGLVKVKKIEVSSVSGLSLPCKFNRQVYSLIFGLSLVCTQ